MLTARDLIARMTPTTLAGLICDLDQYGNQDAAERETSAAARLALEAIVGRGEAELLISQECGGVKGTDR